jgi:hypothetical protein
MILCVQVQKADPSYGVGVNPISRLIQIMQAAKKKEPVYTLVEEKGVARRREFIMKVSHTTLSFHLVCGVLWKCDVHISMGGVVSKPLCVCVCVCAHVCVYFFFLIVMMYEINIAKKSYIYIHTFEKCLYLFAFFYGQTKS